MDIFLPWPNQCERGIWAPLHGSRRVATDVKVPPAMALNLAAQSVQGLRRFAPERRQKKHRLEVNDSPGACTKEALSNWANNKGTPCAPVSNWTST